MGNNLEAAPLSKQTGVTVGLGILILGAAVSAAWWFGQWTGSDRAWKDRMSQQMEGMKRSMEQIREDGTTHRWTSIDMVRWSERLQEYNPDIRVPTPYEQPK